MQLFALLSPVKLAQALFLYIYESKNTAYAVKFCMVMNVLLTWKRRVICYIDKTYVLYLSHFSVRVPYFCSLNIRKMPKSIS